MHTCINCNVSLSSRKPRYRINDREWCATCAAPYRTSALGGALRDVGVLALAVLVGLVVLVVVAYTPLARISWFAGGGAFAWIALTWFFRKRVRVDVIPPA